MKNFLLLSIFSGAIILNSGCSSKLMTFEKRKYTKGYHVEFAEKKNNKVKNEYTETVVNIPQQERKEVFITQNETTYEYLPELSADLEFISDEEIATTEHQEKERKKFFQNNPILKHFSGKKIQAGLKRDFKTILPQKNIAKTSQTTGISFFTVLGALIGGGSLIALTVMLFSNWASVALLIAFVSGCILGMLLLILGANT